MRPPSRGRCRGNCLHCSCQSHKALSVCRDEACKQAEADAEATRSRLRLERAAWEKADVDARSALSKLREEWRMLNDVNAGLHSNIARLNTALEVSLPL